MATTTAGPIPLRTFVRVVSPTCGPYRGRVGIVREHNENEIGVAFTAGRNTPRVWFTSDELRIAQRPDRWAELNLASETAFAGHPSPAGAVVVDIDLIGTFHVMWAA